MHKPGSAHLAVLSLCCMEEEICADHTKRRLLLLPWEIVLKSHLCLWMVCNRRKRVTTYFDEFLSSNSFCFNRIALAKYVRGLKQNKTPTSKPLSPYLHPTMLGQFSFYLSVNQRKSWLVFGFMCCMTPCLSPNTCKPPPQKLEWCLINLTISGT